MYCIRPRISFRLDCTLYFMSQDEVLIDYNQILGHGVYGIVYKGTFEGEIVAVKRTPLFSVTDLITRNEYLVRIRHPNVVIILHIKKDEDFRYTFMELCAGSLDHVFLGKYSGPSLPSNEQVMLQLANGLGYLYSLNILHGDIKPENILISQTRESVQMKWTGFGFGQQPKSDSFSLSLSGPQLESRRWWPPEMYLDEKNASDKGEIFSAGCVFFYFLSRGVHPFGSLERSPTGKFQIANNVQEGSPVNLFGLDLSETNFLFIKTMIMKNPEERIPLWDVIKFLEIQHRQDIIINPLKLSSLQYVEKGYMNGHFSCGLFLSKFDRLAVKRIPMDYCSDMSYDDLKQCNISNVVRILHVEKNCGNLYYVMEFCVASLDQCFPTNERGKLYEGPMPSHEQIFFQLVTGLQYIHEKKLVHGSVKPSNILIYSENDPQIKLSDFGWTFPRWNDNISSTDSADGFQSDRYWMTPQLHNIFDKFERKRSACIFKPTEGDDVFATGKIFFYYYFQTYADVIRNALPSQNAFKKLPMLGFCKIRNDHYPIQLYTEMLEKESPSKLQLKDVIERVLSYQLTSKGELNKPKIPTSENIQFSRDHILGKGGQAVVHLGLWKGSIAAIKRINTRIHKTPEVIRELGFLQNFNHPNIVKFFGYEKDNDFMYIAIERCLISLNVYCRQRRLYQGVIPMRSNKEILLQLAEGLHYIHSQNLIHGDVKPGNILISSDNPANIKFADFGLSKSIHNETDSKEAVDWSFLHGTEGWMAPEMIINCEFTKDEIDGQKCDIFSLGCLFFYFLVPAHHPFGNNNAERRKNVLNGDPTNLKKLSAQTGAFYVIIQGMIEKEWKNRTEIVDVIAKLGAVIQFDNKMCALTEASSQLSVSDDRPNHKRQKFD